MDFSMDYLYIAIVGILFLFAFFDLIVGVSNDAVNFLNSALGSKVAPVKVIMIIASLWILAGALFSSGMMEVARKGIFHPSMFTFADIMVIFLAVMITDVILLDLYNTFRMPTSTTVSIVFELLGAAVAISLFKISQAGEGLSAIMSYINSEKALVIITWILLSVVIAFSVGAIIQYLVRMVFTFKYQKKLKYYGAIWWGIAITAITYFLLIKGAKGYLISGDTLDWVTHNTWMLMGILFVGWTIILQLVRSLWKVNILKFIVLVGTFALAMAFAGNDLVNFIGVPIAGYNSFQLFISSWGANAGSFMMEGLAGKVPTPFYFLLIAGLVMVLTLHLSKKAKSVTETEIGLGRDSVGFERFKASGISRMVIRGVLFTGKGLGKLIPQTLAHNVKSRFERSTEIYKKDAPAFDLVRASVNLTVASVLIAFATSLKLPLSTTYVTFMVAMGASLADGVWGRESAVYRVTGVLAVIGGWFLTAFSAFVLCGLIASFIFVGGWVAILVMFLIAGTLVYRTHIYYGKTSTADAEKIALYDEETSSDLVTILAQYAAKTIKKSHTILDETIDAIEGLKRSELSKQLRKAKVLEEHTDVLKTKIHSTFSDLPKEAIESGAHYVQGISYLRKISHGLVDLVDMCNTYAHNHHPELVKKQIDELQKIKKMIADFVKHCETSISENQDDYKALKLLGHDNFAKLETYKKAQLKRIKGNDVGVRNSMLFLTILGDIQNYMVYLVKLVKYYKRLVK